MAKTEHDLKRLPRWARHAIERLRAQVATADSALSAALGTKQTRVEIDPYRLIVGSSTRCFVPERDTIRFHLKEGYVDVMISGDVLDVRAQNRLTIRPGAANVIEVSNRS